jgi:hypothetical protein
MAKGNNTTLLKVVLFILAVISIIYGIGYWIFPGTLVSSAGANPVEFAWLRWSGGILIGLGIGNLLVFRKPEKQGIYVFMAALTTLLCGLGMLYSWIMKEGSGSTMFIAVPTIIILVISILLWVARQQAKGIL